MRTLDCVWVLGLFVAAVFVFGAHYSCMGCMDFSFCVCAVWYVGNGGGSSWRLRELD